MKKIIITLICFVFVASAYCARQDPVSEVQTLLEQKEYSKAMGMLNRILRDRTLSPSQRGEALEIQAHFYEELMGNPDGALRLYKKILATKLPANHPMKSLANKDISRFGALEERYSEQNLLLKKLQIVSNSPLGKDRVRQQITQFNALVKQTPEYYRLAEAYYYLGLNYM